MCKINFKIKLKLGLRNSNFCYINKICNDFVYIGLIYWFKFFFNVVFLFVILFVRYLYVNSVWCL